ncbi:epoxyqueuosine reductase QueH [Senegalimassilia anaerobia]
MKLLLHACCGPCSLEPTRLLKAAGHDITIYYANSNIHPAEEYEHRLATLRAWAADAGFEVLEGPYDQATWEACVGRIGDAAIAEVEQARAGADAEGKCEVEPGSPDDTASNRCKTVTDTEKEAFADASTPTAMTITADGCADEVAPDSRSMSVNDTNSEEASLANAPLSASSTSGAAPRAAVLSVDPARREARCRACYRLRLEETARVAAERGFEGIGTTLSVSPYQYTQVIREEVERAAAQAGVAPVFEDFRPYYDEATRESRELGMYRQNFCGCRISDLEAAAERAERKEQRAAAKAAERAAHADERAAEEAARAAHKAERAAYDKKQARKRAILKSLREQGK